VILIMQLESFDGDYNFFKHLTLYALSLMIATMFKFKEKIIIFTEATFTQIAHACYYKFFIDCSKTTI
jgi:hypothetical protein